MLVESSLVGVLISIFETVLVTVALVVVFVTSIVSVAFVASIVAVTLVASIVALIARIVALERVLVLVGSSEPRCGSRKERTE